ncbi:MAG: hypothetical protein K6E29_06485 [Cyanobacteria bacterium RUI128]|nr:hypothetical protein [Cyanobacteria bacterium RUI128]
MAKTKTINVNDTDYGIYNGSTGNDRFVVTAGYDFSIQADGKGTDVVYFKSPYANETLAKNTNDTFSYSTANGTDLVISRTYNTFTLYTPVEPPQTEADIIDIIRSGYYYFDGKFYERGSKTDKITLKDYFKNSVSSIKTFQYGSETVDILNALIKDPTFISPISDWKPNTKGVITGSALGDKITITSGAGYFEDFTSPVTVNAGTGNDNVTASNFTQKVTINGGDGDDQITAWQGQNSVINGGNGDDKIAVGMTPNSLTFGTVDNEVYKSQINTGKGENEVHIISSYKNTETHITPTKGENLTIYYEASVAKGSETGGISIILNPDDYDIPGETTSLDSSEFEVYRKGNDIIVERTYTYYQNVIESAGYQYDTTVPQLYNAQTLEAIDAYKYDDTGHIVKVDNKYQLKDGVELLIYNPTKYLDGTIKYYVKGSSPASEVQPEFAEGNYVVAMFAEEAQATDTIVIEDIVNKYDASSLNVVAGYTNAISAFYEPGDLTYFNSRFTFDLIKGTVYNEATDSYEDIKYYSYDDTDLNKKKKITTTGHDELIDLADYNKKSGITINAGGGDDTIIGTKNADVINTGSGNNTIDGGAGNDTIKLGNGVNTVLFGEGSGHDTIYNATYEGTTLVTAAGSMNNLSFEKNGDNLDIKLNDADYVTLNKYFTADSLDNIKFTDGSVSSISEYLTSGEYNANTANKQFLTQTGNNKANKLNGTEFDDILEGGKGNDTLFGAEGKNYLIFQKGDGKDTVKLSVDEELHLVYKAEAGADLDADDFTFTRSGKDVIIARKGTTDTITIKDLAFANPDAVTFNIYNKATEDAEYGAPTTVDLYAYQYEITGTAKNAKKGIGATLTGSALTEKLIGTDYKDTLTSGSGTQTLIGGKGADTLNSGEGATTFEFNTGDGTDKVNLADSSDTLKFNDKLVTALTFSADKNSLTISYGEGDLVTLTDWFEFEGADFATNVVDDSTGDLTTQLATLHQNVATWMDNHTNYDTVGDALASTVAADADAVATLQAYFNFNNA